MTSVKEFRVDEPATDDALGRGAFEFTDDYSVFDWGKMPDEIPDKGTSLCTMGAFNFERLEAAGISTHYVGVDIDGAGPAASGQATSAPAEGGPAEGGAMSLDHALDAGVAPSTMVIELTNVPELPFDEREGEYDYESFHGDAGEHYLVPLEIVFRNRVGVGSSLRKRTDPSDHALDFDEWPEAAVELEEPIVEFSTKYEEQDRYLDRGEADTIAGRATIDALEAIARTVNDVTSARAAEAGFVHEDGKIECLYADGEIRVADVVGTFDENRFSYDGQQVSKEVVRQYHKRTQPGWVEAVGEAKQSADERAIADWKSLCEESPEPLDESVIGVARDLYCAGTNAYVDEDVFDAPAMDDAVAAVREL